MGKSTYNRDKQKYKLYEQAMDYLKKTVFADSPDDAYLNLFDSLSASVRENQNETYQLNLKIFKALFNSGDEGLKLALWNELYYQEEQHRPDFTDEENAFLDEYRQAREANSCLANVNAPIKTARLILRAIEDSDIDELTRRFNKEREDLHFFTGRKFRNDFVKSFVVSRRRPLFFLITQKNTGVAIGYVGLSLQDNYMTCMLEYYIFRDYRGQGYCKEAVAALTQKAIDNKLYVPVETVKKNIFAREKFKFNAIRARISTSNTASAKVVQSAGYIHEATIHNTMFCEGVGWSDEEIYYLPNKTLYPAHLSLL